MTRVRLVLACLAGVLIGAPALPSNALDCPKRPRCEGCGCKGGTGYRGPDGRCVGFALLDAVCGSPPGDRCVFENAPGTGLNRDCSLAKRKKKPAPPPDIPGPDKTSERLDPTVAKP